MKRYLLVCAMALTITAHAQTANLSSKGVAINVLSRTNNKCPTRLPEPDEAKTRRALMLGWN